MTTKITLAPGATPEGKAAFVANVLANVSRLLEDASGCHVEFTAETGMEPKCGPEAYGSPVAFAYTGQGRMTLSVWHPKSAGPLT